MKDEDDRTIEIRSFEDLMNTQAFAATVLRDETAAQPAARPEGQETPTQPEAPQPQAARPSEQTAEYPADYPEARPQGKKKGKKKKRRKKRPLLRLLILIALAVGAYYLLTSELFNITAIEVSGNEYHTAAQIKEIAGLRTGENLFTVKLGPARSALLDDPYIKLVAIRRVPRGTLKIDVTERVEYAAVPYGESYILIDQEGMVLRVTDQEPVLPLLVGMNIVEMTPGKALAVEQGYLLTETLNVLTSMSENDIYFKTIYFSAVVVRAYIYDSLYCEGTPENIHANMANIRTLLEELYQQEITRGVIKVGRDNYITYSPQIE